MGKASRKTTKTTKTKTDWLMQFPNSKNWFIRVRDQSGRRCVKSLGTDNRETAIILALPLVAEHKRRLQAARPRIETPWQRKLEPGLHAGPDGGQIAATERELTYYNHNGAFLRTEPNGGPAVALINHSRMGLPSPFFAGSLFGETETLKRPTVAAKDSDDAIIDEYLATATPRVADEARGHVAHIQGTGQ
jgi:hypothetical protein